MDVLFQNLFDKEPNNIINGVYYFDSDKDGDQFDELDAQVWRENCFRSNWEAGKRVDNQVYHELCRRISDIGHPFIDIACGPGMGLTPGILAENPSLHCICVR